MVKKPFIEVGWTRSVGDSMGAAVDVAGGSLAGVEELLLPVVAMVAVVPDFVLILSRVLAVTLGLRVLSAAVTGGS